MTTRPWELREVRIERDGECNVGERPGRVDRDLVRVGMDLPDEKVRSVFGDRLRVRLTLGERGRIEGTKRHGGRGGLDQSGRRSAQCAQALAPGVQPGDVPNHRGYQTRLLLGAHERKHGSEGDGRIAAAAAAALIDEMRGRVERSTLVIGTDAHVPLFPETRAQDHHAGIGGRRFIELVMMQTLADHDDAVGAFSPDESSNPPESLSP